MSEPVKLALFGSTGLVGRTIMEELVGNTDFRLTAVARREVPLPVLGEELEGRRRARRVPDQAEHRLGLARRPAVVAEELHVVGADVLPRRREDAQPDGLLLERQEMVLPQGQGRVHHHVAVLYLRHGHGHEALVRQQVAAPRQVLLQAAAHLSLTAESLVAQTGTAPEEVDEKLERMAVDSLACVGRLLTALSAEQREQLLAGVEPLPGEDLVGLRTVVDGEFWHAVENLNISGGEPTTRNDLPEMVELFHSRLPRMRKLGINTTGLTPKRGIPMLTRIVEFCRQHDVLLSVRVSLASSCKRPRRAAAFDGRKPSNTNRSLGRPATDNAAMAAHAPGTGMQRMPAARAARTSLKPGSLINGVPASEISATDSPPVGAGTDADTTCTPGGGGQLRVVYA